MKGTLTRCQSCKNAVFLAERLMFCGHLFHRRCFRCVLCNAQLVASHASVTDRGPKCLEACYSNDDTDSQTVLLRNKTEEAEILKIEINPTIWHKD